MSENIKKEVKEDKIYDLVVDLVTFISEIDKKDEKNVNKN